MAGLVVVIGSAGLANVNARAGAVSAPSHARQPSPPPTAATPVPAKTPTPGTTSDSSWKPLSSDITGIVSQFLSGQGAAGIAVAVSRGNARYATTLGDAAEGVPWSTDTRSAYRSITKSFVGTVVLQLVAEGKLSLDDPISRYVPELAQVQGGDAITVRMALEMRTGLPEFSGTEGFSGELNTDYTGSFTDDQLLGYAFAQPLDFGPGSQYEYSNTNFVLLGKVIRAVTGQAWDQAVQQRIISQLGLSSVAYSASDVATPYEVSDVGLESLAQVSPSLYGASGGLFGNIGDLLRWGAALGSGQFLPAGLQQQRLTAISNPSVDDPGSPDYDAYGLAAGEIDGWWGHTGTGLGYESLAMYQASTGTTVAILINTQLPNPNGPAILFKELEPSLASQPLSD
jgi:D-alanyl-D-alanine carboxypeptidase